MSTVAILCGIAAFPAGEDGVAVPTTESYARVDGSKS